CRRAGSRSVASKAGECGEDEVEDVGMKKKGVGASRPLSSSGGICDHAPARRGAGRNEGRCARLGDGVGEGMGSGGVRGGEGGKAKKKADDGGWHAAKWRIQKQKATRGRGVVRAHGDRGPGLVGLNHPSAGTISSGRRLQGTDTYSGYLVSYLSLQCPQHLA